MVCVRSELIARGGWKEGILMVVVLREGATPAQKAEIARMLSNPPTIESPRPVRSVAGEVFCVPTSAMRPGVRAQLDRHPAVARLVPISTSFQLVSKALSPVKTRVKVGEAVFGGGDPVIIAGPCSVEDEDQIFEAARFARGAGAHLLRGGAFKPRTSPYSFQGLGMPGLEMLARAGAASGLPIVTEVMEPGLVGAVAALADVLQIGARNMQNYPLLRTAGRSGRPILLKRGPSATLEEWLLAAEYILAEGNPNVILCERGIRSFDTMTRNVLDLNCVPLLASLTHLPILVDPSHATGIRDLVLPMGVAAIAAGADGLIVEMHPRPDEALSDGEQSIDPATLRRLVHQSRVVRAAGPLVTPDSVIENVKI
jgi:3-deoxy-7-phosphoheptulonate synthase